MSNLRDLTGQTFGVFVVLAQAPRRDNNTRWLVRCTECAAEGSLRSSSLRTSAYARCFGRHVFNRKSSGASPSRKPSGYAAATETFGHYRRAAKRRGLEFSLAREDFDRLTSLPCHYCATPPGNSHKREHYNGTFIYSGIDRRDSTCGYDVDNCLPCCATCNVMKQDLPYEVFVAHVHRIAALHAPFDPVAVGRMAMGRGGNRRAARIEHRFATPAG